MTASRKRAGRLALACPLACGLLLVSNALAAEQGNTARSVLEQRVDAATRELARDPRFQNISEQELRDHVEFVAGNLIFATVHEVGHMLISEMGLPVLGREEDAADAFATLTGLKLDNGFS